MSANSPRTMDRENGRNDGECSGQNNVLPRHVMPEHRKFLSGSLLPDNALSPRKGIGDGDRYTIFLQLKLIILLSRGA